MTQTRCRTRTRRISRRREEESWLIDDSTDESEAGEADEDRKSAPRRRINFTKGFALYQQEKFDRAIAHFERAADRSDTAVGERAAEAAKHIETFRDHYRAGRRALASEDRASASRQFRKALEADKQVADTGYFGDSIRHDLASARAGTGLQKVTENDYPAGLDAYRAARRLTDSNARVRKLGRELENRAQSLYIQAAAKRKTDPQKAASLCREITELVPEDNDYYKKAREVLDEL